VQLEGEPAHGVLAAVVGDPQVAHLETAGPRVRMRFLAIAPRCARSSAWRARARSTRPASSCAHAGPAQHADAVADLHHLLELWLMKTTDVPRMVRSRSAVISSRASCGVSTAVGSSR